MPTGMPKVAFHTLKINGHQWRAGVIRDHGHLVLMATELSDLQSEIRRVRSLFFLSLPICLLVIGFGGWFVAHRAMRPVNLIAETASRITAHGLDQRIPREAHEYHELSRLVEVLNGMMNRLEHSFRHAVRFSADVSHELKTPLTVMQASVQTALKECEPGSTAEQNLIVVSQEAQRLSLITRSLMLLAQADAGQLAIRKETFSLSDEIEALGEDAEILCEDAGLKLEIDVTPGITMCTDHVLMRQALQNLVSNAVKYNKAGGVVSIRLYRDPVTAEAIFEISNTGAGIPEEAREKIFDRFYRVDRARSRNIDGFGLGLNLAWEIVRAIEGELILRKATDEITRFEIRFGQ